MKRRVVLEPAARDDLNQAQDWYEAIRPGLGAQFAAAISLAIEQLTSEVDGSCPVAGDKRARRVLARRFPFQVVFVVRAKALVHVVAVRHTSRKPGGYRR